MAGLLIRIRDSAGPAALYLASYGLAVRIPGFHPGGPGSAPIMGTENTLRASLMAQRLKHLPAMRETWVRSLGREDPLEKDMVTHSSILAWEVLETEKLGGLQSMGSQKKLDTT